MSNFWHLWVVILTTITVVGVTWLLFANRKISAQQFDKDKPPTTGHNYDGIEEYDNPLPHWWFSLFVGTIIFLIIYLVLFTGMGNFEGTLGWTSLKKHEKEVTAAEQTFKQSFNEFSALSIEELAQHPAANKMGQRLFANNCAVCHGSTAQGAQGFPDLTDSDWLYGNSPEQIKLSIEQGRNGNMPPWEAVLKEQQIAEIAELLTAKDWQSLNETQQAGMKTYGIYCLACHGPTGDGNPMLGAPKLNDDVWLYGDSAEAIKHSIAKGRKGVMPAHKDLLSAEKITLLTAYVYSLSNQ